MNRTSDRTTNTVLAFGQQWADAELRGDPAALETLLVDDFVCVGPLGFVLDKQHYIGSRRSGDLKHAALTWEDVRVRDYGEVAVAVGAQTQRSTYQDRDASGRFRVTQVLVRQGDQWRLASLHYSPITQPPEASRS